MDDTPEGAASPRANAEAESPPARLAGTLREVDEIEVVILDDNVQDNILPSNGIARRHRSALADQTFLRGEHGYSLLVTVVADGYRESVLYDAGLARDTVLHNLDVLGVQVGALRAAVLSHGHADHHGGLVGIIARVGRRGLPLILHPDAWSDRKFVLPDGREFGAPPPSRMDLDREGVQLIEERGPSLLLDGRLLVSGEVARTSGFEPGMPDQWRRRGQSWEPDYMVWDDQCLIANLAGKGLVVMSGCSHAGVINVLRGARALTGVDRIHAFVGGCHLSGAVMEAVIPRTVAELEALQITHLVPGHCTGWKALHQIAGQMPESYVPSTVGTTLCFSRDQ